VASGKRKGVHHGAILNKMKRVRQMPVRVRSNGVADVLDIALERLLSYTYIGIGRWVLFGKLIANYYFLIVTKTRVS
jgi:hypothetical protein